MNCRKCRTALIEGKIAESYTVGAREFTLELNAQVCRRCGDDQSIVDADELGKAELRVACWLAEHSASDAASFRFMRKAIGLRARELAELLAVVPETVSKWEKEPSAFVESRAAALLGCIVLEACRGRGEILKDRLRAIGRQTPQSGPIRIKAA